jgi:hypothetical protein
MKRDGSALEFWMSPNGHGMSIGLWIISGVLKFGLAWAWAYGYGLGNGLLLNMSRAAFAWSLEFVIGIML